MSVLIFDTETTNRKPPLEIEGLRDRENPLDIERAKAISNVANSLIESAKVEIKYIELVGGKGSGFIVDDALLPEPERPRLNGTAGRRKE